jgi:iron(III) transport system ATP-binding protein
MAEIRVAALTKRYGDVVAVDGISFEVRDGEFLTLLGPSGCGKSTTLAALAGLERPDGGSIRVGEAVFFDSAKGIFLPPERRNCGLVFQSYALWPHMTVFENCAFPLRLRRVPASRQKTLIRDTLELVEMQPYADRYPHQLSGGQQQRVALARTLVYEPAVLLLDEPLSNLDAKLRERARSWLSQLTKRIGLTTIYVTHDQSEALALSDRIAVMRQGHIAQLGTPKEIYDQPADPFVADFIGSSNFLQGTAVRPEGENGLAVRLAGSGTVLSAGTARLIAPQSEVIVAVRPEKVTLSAEGADGRPEARIIERTYLGPRYLYQIELGGVAMRAESPTFFGGPAVYVDIPREGCIAFPAQPVSQ